MPLLRTFKAAQKPHENHPHRSLGLSRTLTKRRNLQCLGRLQQATKVILRRCKISNFKISMPTEETPEPVMELGESSQSQNPIIAIASHQSPNLHSVTEALIEPLLEFRKQHTQNPQCHHCKALIET